MITKYQHDVSTIITDIICKYSGRGMKNFFTKQDVATVAKQIMEDLDFFVKSDPAAKDSHELVLNSYATFKAIAAYRIAHQILLKAVAEKNDTYYQYARSISEWAKSVSGVEIHPAAEIASPFMIDHGWGVVIGETTKVGKYCYLLNGVVLGAKGIANNPKAKRHPTLGNNVSVAANVEILGDISVGNNVVIGPRIKVTHSIPDNSRLIPITEYYIIRIVDQNVFTL